MMTVKYEIKVGDDAAAIAGDQVVHGKVVAFSYSRTDRGAAKCDVSVIICAKTGQPFVVSPESVQVIQ